MCAFAAAVAPSSAIARAALDATKFLVAKAAASCAAIRRSADVIPTFAAINSLSAEATTIAALSWALLAARMFCSATIVEVLADSRSELALAAFATIAEY